MSITFDLPQEIEKRLREQLGDVSQVAKEAFLIQSYREARLSVGQIAQILGKGVVETQAWLSDRGAPLSYSLEDLEADRKTLARLSPEDSQ